MAAINGTSLAFPNVALCVVTEERVELSASNQTGTGGVVVSWAANRPAAEASIIYTDLAAALTLVAGPDVSADSPPQVAVSGEVVEIVAELHDPALGRPSQTIRVEANCADFGTGSNDGGSDADATPAPPPPSVGRAEVTVDGATHRFGKAEVCQVGSGIVTAQLTDDAGNVLDVIVSGQTGFMSMTLSDALWSAGLSGEPLRPTISGTTATWSGTAVENFSGRQAEAELQLECER